MCTARRHLPRHRDDQVGRVLPRQPRGETVPSSVDPLKIAECRCDHPQTLPIPHSSLGSTPSRRPPERDLPPTPPRNAMTVPNTGAQLTLTDITSTSPAVHALRGVTLTINAVRFTDWSARTGRQVHAGQDHRGVIATSGQMRLDGRSVTTAPRPPPGRGDHHPQDWRSCQRTVPRTCS